MTEIKMTMNVLLSLIVQVKKIGTGKIGNGRLLVKLLNIIADNKGEERSHERNILACFNYKDTHISDAYSKLNKKINRFFLQESCYPYEKLSFTDFEKYIGNTERIAEYLRKMQSACDEIIDCTKLDSLMHTLFQIIRQDSGISTILYGSEFIPKEKLFGSYAKPKRICIEALLLGLLYHVHKNPTESEKIELFEIPVRRTFQTVRFSDEKSLDLDIPIDLIENICECAKYQKPTDMKYQLELRCEDNILTEIPDSGNVFVYGSGGVGKSTLLLNQIRNENTINLYFPLYQYRREIHEKLCSGSCWILVQILLKYHYQYEYPTYETCSACEGEDVVLQQLTELNQHLKNNPNNWKPRYALLLDGMNEIQSELQEKFMEELERINHEWKNVRLIITGRTFPNYDAFSDFEQYELYGLPSFERDKILSENHFENLNPRLLELLKNPLFLNIYLENNTTANDINTQGEILDYYVENYKINTTFDKIIIQFLIKFALPFAAKSMSEEYDLMTRSMSYEIDRGTVSKAIDKAFDFYIETEMVYQNFTASNGIRKKALLECREKYDFVEILIENTCFLKASEIEPHKLHFTHQYFRDYFMAKYFLNLISTIEIVYNSHIDEKEKMFNKYDLGSVWLGDNDFEIYTLIGEICGDYKNIYSDNFIYTETILDKLLDMSRQFNTFRTTENVINTMSAVRGDVICGVNFSDTSLPLSIPRNLKFSMNGDEPCRFNGCLVMLLEILYDYDRNREKNWYDDLIDERLTPEILAKLDNFRNCDFTNAKFIDEDYVNLLKDMGAIIDVKKC